MTVVPEYMTVFQKKHKNGIIDVWWLYDDGGEFKSYNSNNIGF